LVLVGHVVLVWLPARARADDPCRASPCDKNAQCTTTGATTFSCSCNVGYKGDGKSCQEIDACEAKPCDPNALCRRMGPGKFSCTCNDDYVQDGKRCLKVQDHKVELATDSADRSVQEVASIAEEAEEYVRHLVRQHRLDELSARVAGLARDKSFREADELAHELKHVQKRVREARNSAKHVIATAKQQAHLIHELKMRRATTVEQQKKAIEAEASRVVKLAKIAAAKLSQPRVPPRGSQSKRYKPQRPPHPRVPSSRRSSLKRKALNKKLAKPKRGAAKPANLKGKLKTKAKGKGKGKQGEKPAARRV